MDYVHRAHRRGKSARAMTMVCWLWFLTSRPTKLSGKQTYSTARPGHTGAWRSFDAMRFFVLN